MYILSTTAALIKPYFNRVHQWPSWIVEYITGRARGNLRASVRYSPQTLSLAMQEAALHPQRVDGTPTPNSNPKPSNGSISKSANARISAATSRATGSSKRGQLGAIVIE